MYFYLSRPMMDSIIIEANSIEELKSQALGYAEFNEDDLEKAFKETRRNRYYKNSPPDRNFSIMRLIKRELKDIRTKLCPKCLENNDERYIQDDASMCDHHLLEKYELRVTHDATDCLGMVDLLYADEVLEILRRLDK